jgi:aminopeptidase N
MCLLNFNHIQAIHLQDYKVPDFLVERIDLEFDLQEDVTTVISKLEMLANPASTTGATELSLLGESLELMSCRQSNTALLNTT